MSLAVVAVLAGGGYPRAVQVSVTGLTPGVAFSVTAATPDGFTWTVRGGNGQPAAGATAVLADISTPLNVAITYTAAQTGWTPGVSSPVTVPYAVDQHVVTRTNLVTNPAFEVNLAGWQAQLGATLTRDTAAPISGVASALAGGGAGICNQTAPISVLAGDTYTFSIDYTTVGTVTGTPRISIQDPNNVQHYASLPLTQAAPDRFSVTATMPKSGNMYVIVWMPAAGSIHFDNVFLEKSAVADTYFDGSIPPTPTVTYAWTGTPDASRSTELTTITVASSLAVAVLQSLDGRTAIPFLWRDTDDQRETQMRTASFDIPGRTTPVIRWDVSAGDSGEISAHMDRTASEALRTQLRTAGPVMVLRTDGLVRDVDPVQYVILTRVTRALFGAANGYGTDRIWSLAYLVLADPEPSVVLAASNWDDFDAAYVAVTWAQFDTEWSTLTWDQFDSEDWSTH